MPVPRSTLWALKPHTRAKHEILRRYLGAWFGIMTRRNRELLYIDGFCGPGEYIGGEPGSPIIALQVACDHLPKLSSRITFWSIDSRSDRISHLKRRLAGIELPDNFTVKVDCGKFEKVFEKELAQVCHDANALPPSFAFLDPFGFSGMPYEIISDLLSHPKCEVFINLSVDSINRFLDHPTGAIRDRIVLVYGTDDILRVPRDSGDRLHACRMLYQQQLKKAATFVRYFEMRDQRNRIQYYLFFATNHALGFLKMKEAMWRVDPDGEFKFSDRTDPNMTALFHMDNTGALCAILREKYAGVEFLPCRDVRQFVERETPFLSTHMKSALKRLEQEESVKVEELKENGMKRRRGTFPDDAIVTFWQNENKQVETLKT